MQEYKEWTGDILPDPAPRIRNIHIGDIIKTVRKVIEEPLEIRGRGRHQVISETREYEVTAIYPHMIQTSDCKTGFTRCFPTANSQRWDWNGRENRNEDGRKENSAQVLPGSPGGKEKL